MVSQFLEIVNNLPRSVLFIYKSTELGMMTHTCNATYVEDRDGNIMVLGQHR
jgi:hypothetical protein